MEKFKERILNLEKNFEQLNSTVKSIKGSTISVHPSHYSVYDKEQGETPLDEFDTFRFIKFNADDMHMRNSENGNPYQIQNPLYKLINPSKDLLPYIKNGLNQVCPSLNNTTIIDRLNIYSHILLSFSTMNENDFENSDFEMYLFPNHCKYGNSGFKIIVSNDIKKILDCKVWEFKPNYGFIQDITVDFKNTYKLLPHVSAYITPFTDANISVKIKELTTKKVVFTMTYGERDNLDVPNSACLHWLVNGMV
jgi:hypothetical protein